MSDLCYRCGILGHVKRNCTAEEISSQRILGDLYGPWLEAEVEATLLVRDEESLRRVENMRNEYFDNFSSNINTNDINGGEENQIISDEEEEAGEIEDEDHGPIPKNMSGKDGMSCQQAENSKEKLEKVDKLPVEEKTFTGIRNNREQEPNQPEKIGDVRTTQFPAKNEDSRNSRQRVKKTVSRGQPQKRPVVGQKRNLEEKDKSPHMVQPPTQLGDTVHKPNNSTTVVIRDGYRLDTQLGTGPNEKTQLRTGPKKKRLRINDENN